MIDASTKSPLISVIIPTYNEKENIQNCLKSVINQDYQKIELIVVNSSRSTDNTSDLAKELGAIVYEYGQERDQQRRYGVDKSKGSYLMFIDADMVLDRQVISSCLELVNRDNAKAVIIPELSFGENYWAKCKALEKNCYIGDDQIEAARFFDKKSYLEAGGFNSSMISGEDWDLTNRFRKQKLYVGRISDYIHHNEGRLSLISDVKKKLYYSKKSDQYLSSNLKGVGQLVTFVFRPAYFRNWRKLVSDPIHLPGFVVMKLAEIIVGGFGAILFKRTFWRQLLKI